MGTFERFEDIEAWRLSRVLSNEVFELTKTEVFDDDYFNNLYNQVDTIEKMIQGLLSYLSKSDKKGLKYKNR